MIRNPYETAQANSSAEVNNLWDAFMVSRDEGIRNRLLVHYLPVAQRAARSLFSRLPSGTDVDDLTQAAALGLRDAIATFDPGRGIKFESYSARRVKGAALDFLRAQDFAPRMQRARAQKVRHMISQLEMQSGNSPTDEELSVALDMPLDEVRDVRHQNVVPMRVRLSDGSLDTDNSTGVDLENLADDQQEEPGGVVQKADIREFLTKGLSRNERLVVILYYYENLSFREIGQTLDLCESRVSQIHQTVLHRLRERAGELATAD